ncbi:hypothetical protein RZ70_00470 [Apilactobacillus kunkeei]|uniref:hypothetical protein n=1 Tax=Apilactobacillus kunkeei TaxID=148814 RepID=UPI0006BF1D38|nr:hypothetical protein [Apilactobacillus kunkeei]KOY73933.1 hypothetical protein RZ70_00470 [Apilactobacillus kunkeei]
MKESQMKIIQELEEEFGTISKVSEDNEKLVELRKSFNSNKAVNKSVKRIIDDVHKYELKPDIRTKNNRIFDIAEMVANGYTNYEIAIAMKLTEPQVIAIVARNQLRLKQYVWSVIDGKKFTGKTQKVLKNIIHKKTNMSMKKINALPYYQVIATRKVVLVGDE